MKKSPKLIFKPIGSGEDINKPSEVIAYAAKLVSKQMAKAFAVFKQVSDRKQ